MQLQVNQPILQLQVTPFVMKKIIIVSATFFLLLSSCKKENSSSTPATCNKTMTDIAGTYSIVKLEAGIAEPLSDITTSELDACQLDDKIVLNANGTTNYQDLGTACTPSGSESGNWSIGSDGKMTINAGTADVANAEIVSFDCATLVLLTTETIGGIAVKFRLTIKK